MSIEENPQNREINTQLQTADIIADDSLMIQIASSEGNDEHEDFADLMVATMRADYERLKNQDVKPVELVHNFLFQLRKFQNLVENTIFDESTDLNSPSEEVRAKLDEFISLRNTIRDSNLLLQDCFKWYCFKPDDQLYRIGGIIQHDLTHILSDLSDPIVILGLGVKQSKSGRNLLEAIRTNYNCAIKFFETFERFLSKTSTNEIPINRTATLTELIDTLDLNGTNIIIEGDIVIDSFEEFMSYRTLILNAKQAGATEIKVALGGAKDRKTLVITDNATEGMWPQHYTKRLEDAVLDGRATSNLPGVRKISGGVVAAQLAGSRTPNSTESPFKFQEHDGFKSLEFTYTSS